MGLFVTLFGVTLNVSVCLSEVVASQNWLDLSNVDCFSSIHRISWDDRLRCLVFL